MTFDREPAFGVEARGLTWSVYYFTSNQGPAKGKRGTIVFTKKPDETWIIAVLQVGELTREQVLTELARGPDS